MVVHCTVFDTPRIPNLNETLVQVAHEYAHMHACTHSRQEWGAIDPTVSTTLVAQDHKDLCDTLTHPYKCRLLAEDCLFSENLTKDTFIMNMGTVAQKVSVPESSFILYFSTHVVHVPRGKV